MDADSSMIEKRGSPRTDLEVQVLITHPQGGSIVNGWIQNISNGGFGLKIELLQEVKVKLRQGDMIYFETFEEFLCFRGSGEVKWISPENIAGVKFTALDRENEKFLKGFLSCLSAWASSSVPPSSSGGSSMGNPQFSGSCETAGPSCQRPDEDSGEFSGFKGIVSSKGEGTEGIGKNRDNVLREFEELLQALAQEGRSPPQTEEEPTKLDWTSTLPRSDSSGILMTDVVGKTIGYNRKFLEIWKIPESVIDSQEEDSILCYLFGQLKEPEKFINEVRVFYDRPETKSYDRIELKDGKIVELVSQSRKMEGKSVIRIWSFNEISHNGNTESRVSPAF